MHYSQRRLENRVATDTRPESGRVDEDRVRSITSMLKRRGIIRPAFEDYGGVTGLYDFGPVGGRLLRRVQEAWRDHWLSLGNIVEIDSPTITPSEVLEASGHVGAFNDHATECLACGHLDRSDRLLVHHVDNPGSLTAGDLDAGLAEHAVKCPSCGETGWSPSKPMNLMFPTTIGPVGDGRSAFMRPETAQGMFTSYPSLYRHFRQRLPFGAVQIGKGYRNEISPRQGMIRLREFNMAELEYFIDPESTERRDLTDWDEHEFSLVPDSAGGFPEPLQSTVSGAVEAGIIRHPTVAWMMAHSATLLHDLGVDPSRLRFRQHEADEMAHYATDCWDLELHGSYGWIECVGIAHRGCYDLQAQESATDSREYRAWRRADRPRRLTTEIIAPIASVIGPYFKGKAKAVLAALADLEELPASLPFQLELADGGSVQMTGEMVQRKNVEMTVDGEWYTPHVVEPAFGLDRIIWHLLDHAFVEAEREGETYATLRLSELVAPYECAILPLHKKGEMVDLANAVFGRVCALRGVQGYIDQFGKSIGRRYARADEIGVPWAITIDQQSLRDDTATVRRRDDHAQIRAPIDHILSALSQSDVASLFPTQS